MLLRRLEHEIEFPLGRFARFDLVERQRHRQLLAVLKDRQPDFGRRLLGKVLDGHAQPHRHARRRDLQIAGEVRHRQVRVPLLDRLHEVQSHTRPVERLGRRRQRFLILPVAQPEVGEHMQMLHRAAIFFVPEQRPRRVQSVDQRQRPVRRLDVLQFRVELRDERLVDIPLRKHRLLRIRQQHQRKQLRPRPSNPLRHQLFDDAHPFAKRGRVAEPIAHRTAVVQQHHVMRACSAKHRQLARIENQPREQQHESQHQQDSQQQQDQLLDQDTAAVPLLAGQQKFHRREPDLPKPQPIDQMDDDRRSDQCRAGHHKARVQKMLQQPRRHRDATSETRNPKRE